MRRTLNQKYFFLLVSYSSVWNVNFCFRSEFVCLLSFPEEKVLQCSLELKEKEDDGGRTPESA